nr:MAG TPA: tail sheath protein [Caudoviricetes sp.]
MAKLTKPGSNVVRVASKKTSTTEVSPSVSGVIGTLSCLVEPGKLCKVTSWNDFKVKCGILDANDVKDNYLANAVYSYYLLNSGDFYFVIAEPSQGEGAGAKATKTVAGLTVTAKTVGKWGNDISVAVKDGVITLKYGSDVEVFASVEDAKNSYYATITGTAEGDGAETKLAGGTDAVETLTDENVGAAFLELSKAHDITIISVLADDPKYAFALKQQLQNLENEFDRKIACIVSMDGDPSSPSTMSKIQTYLEGDVTGNLFFRYAMYYPNVVISNPCGVSNGKLTVPACVVEHAVYGYYANEFGVRKSPAGYDSTLPNVTDVTYSLTDPQIGDYNSNNINCIIPKASHGIVNWGARLMQENQDRKFVSDLLLDNYIETWIKQDTEWATFESIDGVTQTKLVARIEAFLSLLWKGGSLKGEEPEQAYFVQCNDDTMKDAQEGQIIIEAGWAKKVPAEFITTKVIYDATLV